MSNERSLLSSTELRRMNRNRIYRYIYDADESVTKQDIAQNLNLSLPTVSQNLKELLDFGLIEYTGTFDSTGGRKPKAISVVDDARVAVGISLTNHHMRLIAIDLKLNQLAYKKIACAYFSSEAYSKRVADELELFMDEHSINRELLLGVGVALPGIIDRENEIIEIAPTMNIHNLAVSHLMQYIPYPSYIENDANAGGFAEWWNMVNQNSIAYLSVDKGVGGAILMDGVAYYGNQSRSGEFGHMCLYPGGKQCNCGKYGCFEAYCSTARLSDDLGIELEEFFDRVKRDDPAYTKLWKEYLNNLTVGINSIRMILDCDIVLGGILAQHMEDYIDGIHQKLSELNCMENEGKYLHLSRYRSRSTGIGVALYFVSNFIKCLP